MVRIPGDDRVETQTPQPAGGGGVTWDDFVGFAKSAAQGVVNADMLAKAAATPQGRAAAGAALAAKLGRAAGMDRATFLQICGMAYDK